MATVMEDSYIYICGARHQERLQDDSGTLTPTARRGEAGRQRGVGLDDREELVQEDEDHSQATKGIHSNGDGDRAAALEGELAVFSLGQTRRWAEASGHGGDVDGEVRSGASAGYMKAGPGHTTSRQSLG